ncbi:4-hydroxy-tetrahydrodipicolinate synthase [Acutalibacter caecimuris]|uniref:4-hydroxy-tetrahydrodipicolinate synthase n=1 Tax=Acutalibacter caecimuris TaxID=3093657 RepID=UPI002AC9ECD3|nr:4-hydroxy-tetrahydrodipicolinate synthase [Acutalibacter sp. M00118]
MKNTIFTGVGTALATPFNCRGEVAWDELEKLVEMQVEGGVDAIIACGTTGEAATMSSEEHLKTIAFIVEKAKGRVPVIAGTGSNDTCFCVNLSLQAKALGVEGLLLVTPYYNKTSQKGLVESFHYIADCVELPCILYNVPSRTGCNILPETYQALSKNPYIVATKEANGDTASVARTIALCGDELAVYSGEDSQALAITALGGKGVISVFSNVLPQEMRNLTHAVLDGDLDTARKLNSQYIDLMDGLFMDVNPIPVKEALWQMGLISTNFCRMPLTTMPEGKQAAMAALLKKHGLV